MRLESLFRDCLRQLSRLRRLGWRGTGLGVYRNRSATVERRPCVLSFGANLYGGEFEGVVGLKPKSGKETAGFYTKVDRALHDLGYEGCWRGPQGQRGYRKGLSDIPAIDEEWERLLGLSEASKRKTPIRRAKRLSRREVDRLFIGLVRWLRNAHRRGWRVAGAEMEFDREESAYGYRWLTRRDILLDKQGGSAAFFAWPRPPFRAPDRKRLEVLGFYERANEGLAVLGFAGRWGPMSAARPNELSADHWRRRLKPRELPRVWKALSDWRLPSRP